MLQRLTRVGPAVAAAAMLAASGVVALVAAGGAVAQQAKPAAKIGNEPNMNGVWQAVGSAHWNIEPHSAEQLKGFEALGAIGAVPAGLGVVEGGEIPYLPEAKAKRDANKAAWPAADPEAKCYLPGVPRATYMNYPFQIIQGGGGTDLLFVYEYGSANRVIHMSAKPEEPKPPIDTWMGLSNGSWNGNTLEVITTGFNGESWLDRAGNFAGAKARVSEKFTVIDADHLQYEATIENPEVFSKAWTIKLPLYRLVEPNAQVLEYKCVPFSEDMLYGYLKPKSAAE